MLTNERIDMTLLFTRVLQPLVCTVIDRAQRGRSGGARHWDTIEVFS